MSPLARRRWAPHPTIVRALVPILAVVVTAACNNSGWNHIPAQAAGSTPVPGSPRPPELVLPLEVDMTLAETFVRIGFGLEKGFQSTDFLTPRLRTGQAVPLIKLVPQSSGSGMFAIASF